MLHILLFLSVFNIHDHHVSVCDIIFNQKNGSIEIIQSVIADDFEKALKSEFKLTSLDLLNPEMQETNEKFAKKYFEEMFQLFQNGEKLEQTWIGFEVIDNQLRAYIEIEGITNTNNLTLNDRILINEFRKQQNMVHWKFGKNLKTTVLSRRETVVELLP